MVVKQVKEQNTDEEIRLFLEGKENTIKELIETLRNWEDMFYSESETKLIMKQAADLIEWLISCNRNRHNLRTG